MFYSLIFENETGHQIDLSQTANRFILSKIGQTESVTYAIPRNIKITNSFELTTQNLDDIIELIYIM
jgi:hypothetical protein